VVRPETCIARAGRRLLKRLQVDDDVLDLKSLVLDAFLRQDCAGGLFQKSRTVTSSSSIQAGFKFLVGIVEMRAWYKPGPHGRCR
jgi:hypothetical protein